MKLIYMHNVDCSILIFVHMLLLPEGETGKGWEPSKNQCFFGYLHLHLLLYSIVSYRYGTSQ